MSDLDLDTLERKVKDHGALFAPDARDLIRRLREAEARLKSVEGYAASLDENDRLEAHIAQLERALDDALEYVDDVAAMPIGIGWRQKFKHMHGLAEK